MNSIRDTIDVMLRKYYEDNEDEPTKLKLDTYSYAMLMEELGHNPEKPFYDYRGMKIKVDPDLTELCEVI